jgi:hypothetical protein
MVIASVAVVAVVATTWAILSSSSGRQIAERGKVGKAGQTDGDGAVDAGRVIGGGSWQKTAGKATGFRDYGKLPAIKANANPQVRAVAEALLQKKHPERVSMLASLKPFNEKSYKADPSAYLNTVEPGRVFQTAQPGPNVPVLKRASADFCRVTQGESVLLRVNAPAGAPVSFTSLDCGQFGNLLPAITVQANDKGVAEAKFTTTPGTINKIHILAGSPLASSQVRFVVSVALPETLAQSQSTVSLKAQP